MFKKINNYLLTHHPVLWNLRLPTTLLIIVVIHILFFTAGFVSINALTIGRYYNIKRISGETAMIISALFSFLIIIVWLIYVLRNNPFKSFFNIDKFYGVKLFFGILTILWFSITFYESYYFGLRTKIRNFTSLETAKKEENIINQAMAFIPLNEKEYFIGNNCEYINLYNYNYFKEYKSGVKKLFKFEAKVKNGVEYKVVDSNYLTFVSIMQSPNLFSYSNYCNIFSNNFSNSKNDTTNYNNKVNEIFKNTNLLTQNINEFQKITQKYDVKHSINTNQLVKTVLEKPIFNYIPYNPNYDTNEGDINRNEINSYGFSDIETYREQLTKLEDPNEISNDYRTDYTDTKTVFNNPKYINTQVLRYAINNIAEAHESFFNKKASLNNYFSLLISLYIAACFSMLLFLLKRTSNKILFLSIIGTVGWVILISLIGIFFRTEKIASYLIATLLPISLIIHLILRKRKGYKLFSGIWLNWFAFLIPITPFFICYLISDNCEKKYEFGVSIILTPFSCWVQDHGVLLFIIWTFTFLIITPFCLSYLTKKWHIKPEM